MKKTKLLTSVALGASVLLLATACSSNPKDTNTTSDSTTQSSKTKETKQYVKDATFYVGKDGKAILESEVPKDAIIVDWYLDPYCPACVKLEDLVKDTNEDYLNNKNVVIKYHTLGFLSPRTVDDYSTRASAWILGVTQERPDLVYKYIKKIITADFRPDGQAKSDAEFKAKFIEIGGTEKEWKTITGKHNSYKEEVEKNTALAFNDESLEKKSPTGALFTPFIIIGNSEKALNFEGSLDAVDYYTTELDKYIKENTSTSESKETTTESSTETSSSKDSKD